MSKKLEALRERRGEICKLVATLLDKEKNSGLDMSMPNNWDTLLASTLGMAPRSAYQIRRGFGNLGAEKVDSLRTILGPKVEHIDLQVLGSSTKRKRKPTRDSSQKKPSKPKRTRKARRITDEKVSSVSPEAKSSVAGSNTFSTTLTKWSGRIVVNGPLGSSISVEIKDDELAISLH